MSEQTNFKPLLAQNLFSVNGLNIVITGGGSGLGAYMARALAVNGASKVFILGRRREALDRTKSSLPEEYAKVIVPIVADVISKESLADALATVTETHQVSTLDVLICNSGIGGPEMKIAPSTVAELAATMLAPSEQDITQTYHVNMTGVHLTVATFLPLLDAANKARSEADTKANKPRPQIITTSSIGAFNRRLVANLSYGPSKAGVVHMTKQLSTLLVPFDIRANTIAPGFYLSEMTEEIYRRRGATGNHDIEGVLDRSFVPATRGGDEEDMSGVVLFLCSRAGSYVNGSVVTTDGGRLAVVPSSY